MYLLLRKKIAMIEVKNIHKSFGKKRVLNGVDLQIPKGKITSLIGSNGAGKTTLLYIMSRLLPQDEGEVLVEGRNIEDYKSKILAQRLAILRQSNHTLASYGARAGLFWSLSILTRQAHRHGGRRDDR